MSSLGIHSSDPGRSNRIDQVVAREMSRSRTLLWFYSLLLVIPLGACALYYQYGRTDVALVHNEVNRNVAPIREMIEQTQPALAQVLQSAERLSAQEMRVESLSQKQEALATTVQSVPNQLRDIGGVKTDLSVVKGDMEALQARNQELRGSLENALTGVAQLNERINGVTQQQTRIDRDLKDLTTRFEKVRPTNSVNSDDQLRRQQELIDDLRERIQKLEQPRRVDPRTERPQ